MLKNVLLIFIFLGLLVPAFAETDEENFYRSQQKTRRSGKKSLQQKVLSEDPESVTHLSENFISFKDIVVIQRKYLPKSKRVEVAPGLMLSLSNPYFHSLGGAMRFSYSMNEKFSFDFLSHYLFEVRSKYLSDLRKKRIQANAPLSEIYTGGSVRWSPIYGKLALFRKSIVYFDMYFALGAGLMFVKRELGENNHSRYQVPSAHARVGQSYAVNKSFATYWDLAFHAGPFQGEGSALDVSWFLTLGLSWFYPEAGYR